MENIWYEKYFSLGNRERKYITQNDACFWIGKADFLNETESA